MLNGMNPTKIELLRGWTHDDIKRLRELAKKAILESESPKDRETWRMMLEDTEWIENEKT